MKQNMKVENIGISELERRDGRLSSGFTLRAFVLGALLCLFIGFVIPYTNTCILGSYLSLNFSTPIAMVLIALLVGMANVLLGLLRKTFVLTRTELVTIYIMMLVACTIPSFGFTEYMLPQLAAVFYYATPENDWANLIHPYIKDWTVPQGDEGIKWFFEGLPGGYSVPWGIWIRPLIFWCSLFVVLSFVMICMMVILRRQWMDGEKLTYPLIQTPLEMIKEDGEGRLLKPFLRNPVLWVGFAIPAVILSINAFHTYYHIIPAVNLWPNIPIFRRTLRLPFRVNFAWIGFSYFVDTNIAMGIWVFYLLGMIEQGIFNVIGFQSTETLDRFSFPQSPYLSHQGMGAMIVFVLFGLWTARGHLRSVFRKAFRGDAKVPDDEEILSYRMAVFGMIGGLLFMWIWIWRSGLPFHIVPLFLFGSFVLYIALTRVVVQGGIASMRPPMIGSSFVISGIGTSAIGTQGLISLAMTYGWHSEVRTFVMASCANGLKLVQDMKGSRRPLLWAMILAMLFSLVGSIWMVLYLAYGYGGINLREVIFISAPTGPFMDIAPKLLSPEPANLGGWIFTSIGGAIMGLLMFAQHRLLWWPLHPLGFAICVGWKTGHIWFSIFLAWMFKSVILKYGGPKLFRTTRPFFMGLILGEAGIAAVWLIIDYFTGMTNNLLTTM